MNPIYPTYNYTSNVIQLQVQDYLAVKYKGINIFISEQDVQWNIPETVFDNS
jgi:hypothetical protein